MSARHWILTFTCADRVGIVAAITGELAACGGFILDSQQYADLETGRFFMRMVFTGAAGAFPTTPRGCGIACVRRPSGSRSTGR